MFVLDELLGHWRSSIILDKLPAEIVKRFVLDEVLAYEVLVLEKVLVFKVLVRDELLEYSEHVVDKV